MFLERAPVESSLPSGFTASMSYFLSDDYARKGRCERPARSQGHSLSANGRPPADNSEDWKGPAYQTCIHAAAACREADVLELDDS
jgi:hypothetical protein